MIDLPPQFEQAILDTAKARGISTDELLLEIANEQQDKLFFEQLDYHGIHSQANVQLSNKDLTNLLATLEQPKKDIPAIAKLLKTYGGLGV